MRDSDIPQNHFKAKLGVGKKPQIGLWCQLASSTGVEAIAGSGTDWLVLDAEHGPNDIPLVLAQLQALAPFAVEPIVRPPVNDPVLIKQYLDIGARALLLPIVHSVSEAEASVAATRYPPNRIRGIAISQRANKYGRKREEYFKHCEDEIFVIIQIEKQLPVDELIATSSVEGVDAVFIGPSDLSASMQQLGNPSHSNIQAYISQIFEIVHNQTGKPAGILTPVEEHALRYLKQDFAFVGIGSDIEFLVDNSDVSVEKYNAEIHKMGLG